MTPDWNHYQALAPSAKEWAAFTFCACLAIAGLIALGALFLSLVPGPALEAVF